MNGSEPFRVLSAVNPGRVAVDVPWADPERVAASVADQPGTLWLDCADGSDWRYVLTDPMSVASVAEGLDPFANARAALQRLRTRRRSPALDRLLPPFVGGLAGLFGYELGRRLEPSLATAPLPAGGPVLPELWLGLYRDVVAFDPASRRVRVVCQPWGTGPTAAERAAVWRGRLEAARGADLPPPEVPRGVLGRDRDATDYARLVEEVVDRIRAGEVYQANLSQRFTLRQQGPLDPFGLYRRLRAVARPARGAFLQLGEAGWVASASPERLVRVQNGHAEAAPIKGTRPRGAEPRADAAALAALRASPKDRAENVMIVDLLRNDLSRVCADGSIGVPALCAPVTLPTVHHLVSRVTGRARPGVGPFDVISALFPGGSITGAPKVQAMRVIAELEPTRRGPYCGSIGWVGANGDLDLNIGIRTACPHADGQVAFCAGGGVVFDSSPQGEEAETRVKAKAFAEAVGQPPPWEPGS